MNRFALLGLVVLLVVAGWTGAWYFFAGQVREQVNTLAANDGQSAPRLTCGDLDVGGFPFRFDVGCAEADILTGDISIAVPRIEAHALVYRPTHFIASAEGPADISNAFTGARNVLRWQDLDASLQLTDWRIERFSLVGKGVEWIDTLIGESLIARTPDAQFHLIDMPDRHDDAAGLSALAGYAFASELEAPGIGIESGETSLEAELTGLPGDLRAFDTPDALQRWQQSGGELRIVSLRGSDGEDTMSAEGNMRLTEAGLVEGQIAIESNGLVERFAAAVPEPMRSMVLGESDTGGGFSQTINIRGGVVMAGLLPAAMIPPLFVPAS